MRLARMVIPYAIKKFARSFNEVHPNIYEKIVNGVSDSAIYNYFLNIYHSALERGFIKEGDLEKYILDGLIPVLASGSPMKQSFKKWVMENGLAKKLNLN